MRSRILEYVPAVIHAVTLIICLCCGLMSCTTTRQVEFRDVIDTLIITKTDTVKDVHYVTKKEKEYVDRWNDRIVTINLKGDTIKDVIKQTVYVEKDNYLRDSVDYYRKQYEALLSSKNHSEVIEKEKKQPWYKDFVNSTTAGVYAFLAAMILFSYEHYLRRKKNG